MKTKLISLFIVVILFVSSSLQANDKIHLKLNLKKGSIYEVTTVLTNATNQNVQGIETKVNQKMETGFSFKVLDVLPNKNFLIEYSIKKIKMNVNMDGREGNYDSESTNGDNPMNNILKTLPYIKMEVSNLGKLISMESFDLESIRGDPQVVALIRLFLGNKSLESFIAQMFNYFPDNKVGKGDKWNTSVKQAIVMNMETVMNFEVAAIDKNQIRLNVISDVNTNTPIEQYGVKIDMKLIGKQNGSMTIDPTDGWIRSSDLIQKFNINMKMKDPKTKLDTESPTVSNSETKITIIKK